jgi:hypothetical protein
MYSGTLIYLFQQAQEEDLVICIWIGL